MPNLLIVNNADDFNVVIPDVEIITAKTYLSDPRFAKLKSAKVFNLCRSYKYQTTGYYVSLLAAARGHKAIPDITTVQDTKTHSIIRLKSDELEDLIQKSLNHIEDSEFKLDIFFGRHLEQHFDALSLKLFQQFQAPLLRALFLKHNSKWHLHNIDLLPGSELSGVHLEKVRDFATDFFTTKRFTVKKPVHYKYEMAILVNPQEKEPPSDEAAIKKFIKAAEELGIGAWTITREEYSHLPEYDALFIRETTNVNHHTYRFARRAVVERMIVLDDPESILRCSNKVYLAELLEHNHIPTPKTLIVNRDNAGLVKTMFTYPLILKQPDSAFSQGVKKVKNDVELEETLKKMLDKSDLIIAQEFLPTSFDWRIGIIDQQPLYACKYYMADKHWQIINCTKDGSARYGNVETFDIKDVPEHVIQTALKAANLIGNGLYGVDLKELDGKTYVIEVNDNPNLDAGVEDKVIKNDLYSTIMKVFLKRLESIKTGKAN